MGKTERDVLELLRVLEITVDALPGSREVVADAIAEIERLREKIWQQNEGQKAFKILYDDLREGYDELYGFKLQYTEAEPVGWEARSSKHSVWQPLLGKPVDTLRHEGWEIRALIVAPTQEES